MLIRKLADQLNVIIVTSQKFCSEALRSKTTAILGELTNEFQDYQFFDEFIPVNSPSLSEGPLTYFDLFEDGNLSHYASKAFGEECYEDHLQSVVDYLNHLWETSAEMLGINHYPAFHSLRTEQYSQDWNPFGPEIAHFHYNRTSGDTPDWIVLHSFPRI